MANDKVATRAQSACRRMSTHQNSSSSKERHNLSRSKFFEINVRRHIPRLQPNGASPSRGLAHSREPAASRALGYSGSGIFGRRSRAPRPLPDGLGDCSATTSSRRGRTRIPGWRSRSPRRRRSVAAGLCGACRDRSVRCRACPPRPSRRILGRSDALKLPLGPRSSGEATQWSNQSMSGLGRDCLADARDGALRCPTCGSPRLACHAEIETLSSPTSFAMRSTPP
jgi:hypothetical protein